MATDTDTETNTLMPTTISTKKTSTAPTPLTGPAEYQATTELQQEVHRYAHAIRELRHWYAHGKEHFLQTPLTCPAEAEYNARDYLPDYKDRGYPSSQGYVARALELKHNAKKKWIEDNKPLLSQTLQTCLTPTSRGRTVSPAPFSPP
jgi:hypothetical protein